MTALASLTTCLPPVAHDLPFKILRKPNRSRSRRVDPEVATHNLHSRRTDRRRHKLPNLLPPKPPVVNDVRKDKICSRTRMRACVATPGASRGVPPKADLLSNLKGTRVCLVAGSRELRKDTLHYRIPRKTERFMRKGSLLHYNGTPHVLSLR
jgi:hypothetical protein